MTGGRRSVGSIDCMAHALDSDSGNGMASAGISNQGSRISVRGAEWDVASACMAPRTFEGGDAGMHREMRERGARQSFELQANCEQQLVPRRMNACEFLGAPNQLVQELIDKEW